jgi:subtilisin family serine protease
VNRLLYILSFLSALCFAKCPQQRVAIVDTGLNPLDPRFESLLCKDAQPWDLVTNAPLKEDIHGHGTHITGLIKEYAKNADYCLLIYRYYSPDRNNGNLYRGVDAFRRAAQDRATIVNFSSGGKDRSAIECNIISAYPNITFIVAAGNEGVSIDPPGGYHPASCGSPNIIAVGSLKPDGTRMPSSNYGEIVKAWELGFQILSTLPFDRTGIMSGTSQATAIHTGKTVLQRWGQCDSIH